MSEHLINLFIVEGDTTTRGGKVVSACGLGTRHKGGQRMACIGDKVRYDDGREFVIEGGSTGPRMEIGGRFIAMEGDRVSDGSHLVASTVKNRSTYIGERKDASEWSAPRHDPGASCDKPEFFALYNYFKKMADKLNTDVDFIMAQSAQESEWATSRAAREGNNLFGFNRRIDDPRAYKKINDGKIYGTNAVYRSIEECIQAWMDRWGEHAKGAKTLDDYINGLVKAGYNSRPEYKQEVKGLYNSVKKRKDKCNIPK